MATYPETKIFEGLLAHLGSASGLPTAISWPNKAFTPPSTGRYLRVSVQPNTTEQAALGDAGPNRHQGIMQVTVVDKQNIGAVPAQEIAGAIVAHFNRKIEIAREGLVIKMQRPAALGGLLITESGAEIPVTIWWWCDAPNE